MQLELLIGARAPAVEGRKPLLDRVLVDLRRNGIVPAEHGPIDPGKGSVRITKVHDSAAPSPSSDLYFGKWHEFPVVQEETPDVQGRQCRDVFGCS